MRLLRPIESLAQACMDPSTVVAPQGGILQHGTARWRFSLQPARPLQRSDMGPFGTSHLARMWLDRTTQQ